MDQPHTVTAEEFFLPVKKMPTKTTAGTFADKAGLTNGGLNVLSIPEIANDNMSSISSQQNQTRIQVQLSKIPTSLMGLLSCKKIQATMLTLPEPSRFVQRMERDSAKYFYFNAEIHTTGGYAPRSDLFTKTPSGILKFNQKTLESGTFYLMTISDWKTVFSS